ncbi:hypothetical protein [uncultured Gimesia sp.]|uniref:hypothetical protein n=1 Tax=uncultured Gimesia sp. TaxID=1678688 RepID=UPI0030D94CD0|tara:strand:- start:235393 stop:235707 length:315 start_codon:yes stop_codon:yes gene_type:complete
MGQRWFKLQVVFVVMALLPLTGCGYPEVSPQTYEISKALYSVCNQKSEERLVVVQELIEGSLENKEISENEADWLNGIIKQAQEGNWKSAMQESRRLMEDQADR